MALIQRFRDKRGRFAKAVRRKLLRQEIFDTEKKRVVATTDLRAFDKVSEVKRRVVPIVPDTPPPEIDPERFEEVAALQFTVALDEPFWDQVKEGVLGLPQLERGDAIQLDITARGSITVGRLIPAGTLNEITETIVLDIGGFLNAETGDDIESPRQLLGSDPASTHTKRRTIQIRLVVLRDRIRRGAPRLRDL